MRNVRYWVCLLLALMLIAASCGDDDSGTADDIGGDSGDSGGSGDAEDSGDSGDAGDATECTAENVGGDLTFGTFAPTAGLDPVQITGGGTSGEIESVAVFDTLVRYDQALNDFVPHMAESVEPNDDYSEWTVVLRPGISFSNGDALDATAVKASIERHTAEDSTSRLRGLVAGNVVAIEIVDDLTLSFELAESWPKFPYLLSRPPGMITNEAVVADVGAEAFQLDPAGGGAGPYTVARFVPNEELVLEARADYWGGPVCIETLRFIWVPGGQGTWEAFQSGEIQAGFLREPAANADAIDAGVDVFRYLKNAGGIVVANNGARGSDTPTSDVRLRRALQLAIDPVLFDDRVNDGESLPTSAVVHPDSILSTGAEGLPYDPDAAAALVEEVKAEGEWDGSIRLYCHNAPSRADWPIAMEAQLEAVGFDVEVKNDWDIHSMIKAVLIDGDFDLACWGFNIEEEIPYNAMQLNFTTDNPSNFIGYSNAEMDQAIADLKAADSLEAEQAAIADIQEVWNETVPSPIYEALEEMIIADDSVRGLLSGSAASVVFSDAYLVG
ncbi:MAG: ABC transporter substrate-binding protein [Acidimicrobiales bacterium]